MGKGPGQIYPVLTGSHRACRLRIANLPALRYEKPADPALASQDALMVVRISGPRGNKPGITRIIVIDGVSEVNTPSNDPALRWVTPRVETADGPVEGPIYVNRLLLKELRLNVPVIDAVNRVHEQVHARWGHLKPREIPQSAIGVVELRDYADGRIEGEAWRWADIEVWTRDETHWTRNFDEHIWPQSMRDPLRAAISSLALQRDLQEITPEQYNAEKHRLDREIKNPREVWTETESVGRYPGVPKFQHIVLPDNWKRLMVSTDGPRFTEHTIGEWPRFMSLGPQFEDAEVKPIDDCAFVIVSREEFDQWIYESAGLDYDGLLLA